MQEKISDDIEWKWLEKLLSSVDDLLSFVTDSMLSGTLFVEKRGLIK